MASKRFLIVPEDSSAASMQLPGATMARATLLRSVRFIDASSRALCVLASQNRRFSGSSREKRPRKHPSKRQVNAKKTCAGAGEAGGSFRRARPLRDLRIEFALDVTLRHLGGGQHLLDLARLTGGIEFLPPPPAHLPPPSRSPLHLFSRIHFPSL